MEAQRRLLIVDSSRVARAALVKHLSAEYELREESDGESAWQTLVLDPSIVAVVAAINLGKCDGYALLQRLRKNRLHRLSDLPFFLLISESEPAANRAAAKERGVSDFIVRGMSGEEISRRIGRLVNWEINSTLTPLALDLPSSQFSKQTAMCRKLCEEIGRHASPADQDAAPRDPGMTYSAVTLAFGLTQEAMLVQRFGQAAVDDLGLRVARLIQSKTNGRDLMAHVRGSDYLIASPGTSLATAQAFAQRVCRALGEQAVRIGKERLHVSVSAGLASLPADSGRSAAQLMELALQRLTQARSTPGNLVVSCDPAADDPFAKLGDWLGAAAADQRLAQAGLDMLPLMRLLETEFALGLPLEHMENQFREHLAAGTPRMHCANLTNGTS
ncbi:diguanylate cyclase domain-containing protein [Azonexus sp.]|uniref:GGDEF domain-containing response regulator n=1 Tax=Azonexus sp. TaxID=1872668 RepID=UPI0039E5641D